MVSIRFLYVSRFSPSLNRVEEYPEHRVKLDAIHLISEVSMSVASFFTLAGVTMEGP